MRKMKIRQWSPQTRLLAWSS
uniref:Uncharacterized protein n=2 Tax=Timema TaxID=61471 RepID=A0A7R9G7M0_TIMSH|nr:unnamed protein product [Timema shepardi]CAD7422156.1 unnamed protein product [Timema poppensis]